MKKDFRTVAAEPADIARITGHSERDVLLALQTHGSETLTSAFYDAIGSSRRFKRNCILTAGLMTLSALGIYVGSPIMYTLGALTAVGVNETNVSQLKRSLSHKRRFESLLRQKRGPHA